MASIPTLSDLDSADDSSEDEIFFGPLSDKEAKLARRLMKRRTQLFIASRPSLEEFRRNNDFMLETEDDSFNQNSDEYADSLDEKSANCSSICSDSGIDIKTSVVIDGAGNFQNNPSTVRESNCSQSTTYYSATSEVDNHVVCMEDSFNNGDRISPDTATYYSITSEAERHVACLEDSLNSMDHFSLASRIDQTNDSMEVHARRQSSIRLSDSVAHSQLLFDNEESGSCEVVSESSLEQDSYSMPVDELENQMDLLDVEDVQADVVSTSVSQEDPEPKHHSANSPNSSKFISDAAKDNFTGIYDKNEHPPESNSALNPTPNPSIDQEDKFTSKKYSVFPAPPSSPEFMCQSLLSVENDERSGAAAEDEITSFKTSPATLYKISTEMLFTSPLMASCIAKSGASSNGKCFEENSTSSEQVVSDIADDFLQHESLREFLEPTEPSNNRSEYLESCDMLLENEYGAEVEILNISASMQDDVNAEKPTANSPTTINKDAEVHSKCLMVDHATSICESKENTIDAKDQCCQTSFFSNAEKADVANSLDVAFGFLPSREVRAQKRGTPLSSQKPRRIPVNRTVIGHPCREPIFKTPTKPPLRVLTPCSSASKRTDTPKASDGGKRLTPTIKSRFDHITSPVAKYIKDSAVTPLISNSKPIMARGNTSGATPKTRIPVPSSSGKKLPSATVSSANKGILAPFTKIATARRPAPKSKNKLNFAPGAGEDAKENYSIEDSIFEELKITLKDLSEIHNKKLKHDIRDYVKTRKAMIVNAAKEEASTSLIRGSSQSGDAAPSLSYKGASSLATKQVDLLTQLHTAKNKNVVCSPGQPTILKHTGERKVLHWADGFLSEVNALSSPLHPKNIAPTILMKNAHKKSSRGSSCSNTSVVDVSIVEVINPMRTNTLANK